MPDIGNIKSPSEIDTEKPRSKFEGLLQHRRVLIVMVHILAFTAALMLAFLFTFKMDFQRLWFIYPFPLFLLFSVVVKLIVFARFGQYRGWWQYVGISDLIGIAKASLASTLILFAIWWSYSYFNIIPVPKALGEKVAGEIAQIRNDLENYPVDDHGTVQLRRRWQNLRGLYNLIELGRFNQIQKNTAKIKDKTQQEQWQYRLLQLIEIRKNFDAILILDIFTTIMFLGGLRMVVRLYHEEYFTETRRVLKPFLIVGAGDAGEALLREIMRMKVQQYEVVGFVDDDQAKQGMDIHGINVLGRTEELPDICYKHKVEEIAIAIPSATRKQLRRVVQICQGTKAHFQTVPSITDIASGKLRVSQIREVNIDDLLGRDVVELDLALVESFLKDKTILVTGAGGSIGSEMARQVCKFAPKLLLLVEQAENPLFFIERELRHDYEDVAMEAIICDITDKVRVDQIFAEYRPQVVIHAAAHKHVPLMETNPGESIKNNVIGTKTISDASDAIGADDFVMISTDKAVNPTSLMGSSKRIAEMYIQDLNSTSGTHFTTVRFGNVLGSNGSVVPIFKKQIAAGGPVTVTHPEMQRYFMTIPEASQLVLQAAAMGKGGEIFVLDMGEPVKIVDLARELITLSGFRPGEDIEVAFSGLRPGEKLFEELSIEGEDMLATKHPKIAAWKNIPKDRETLRKGIEELVEIAQTQQHDRIVSSIKTLIPEYIGDKNSH